MRKLFKNPFFLAALFLFLFAVIAYIPKIQHFGYYNDDWWQIYGGEKFGVERFPEMYTSDRPARAYWHAFLFSLFGANILPYQFLAVGIRYLGALALFWTLKLIWKKQVKEVFLISLIFLIYPGFLEQPNGFDYQIHQVAMTTFIFSLGLSVLAIQSKKVLQQVIFFVLSSIFSLITFFFMEYYVGLEIYRWLIFICLYLRENSWKPIKNLVYFVLKKTPYSFSMVLFLIWRVFFFKSSRYTTSISRIGSDFLHSPLLSLINIFRNWIGDISDVFFTVWVKRGYKNLYDLNTGDFFSALGLTVLSIILVFIFIKWVYPHSSLPANKEIDIPYNWKSEALQIGIFGAILCLIPVNLAGREVFFPIFNRFSFPSSIGVSIAFVGLLSYLTKEKLQWIPLSLLIISSITTHYSNNTYYADRWLETKNFWQQWVWRVPGLKVGTMLSGFYPETIQEGYFIWAPANLLYDDGYPDVMIGAEVLNNETAKDILMGAPFEKSFRSFYYNFSFADSLIFTKPTRSACLRFLDKDQIELSINDHPLISQVSSASHPQKITQHSTFSAEMYQKMFGQAVESPTWCYIYEKASLARQFGNWQEIIDLHAQAQEHNLHPADTIEWFPFLQAYAYLGNEDEVAQFVPIINETPYYRFQACQIFSHKEVDPDPAIQAGNELLASLFCN